MYRRAVLFNWWASWGHDVGEMPFLGATHKGATKELQTKRRKACKEWYEDHWGKGGMAIYRWIPIGVATGKNGFEGRSQIIGNGWMLLRSLVEIDGQRK